MCVAVCPTGIDIRNGLQIECIGCAQCIDACDAVMTKVGRDDGADPIQLADGDGGGEDADAAAAGDHLSDRAAGTGVDTDIPTGDAGPADVAVMRGLGLPFVTTPEGGIENTLRVKLTNRTDHAMRLSFSVVGRKDVVVSAADKTVDLAVGQTVMQPVHLIAPAGAFKLGFLDVTLRVSGQDGTVIDRPCRLLGPIKQSVEELEHDEH